MTPGIFYYSIRYLTNYNQLFHFIIFHVNFLSSHWLRRCANLLYHMAEGDNLVYHMADGDNLVYHMA